MESPKPARPLPTATAIISPSGVAATARKLKLSSVAGVVTALFHMAVPGGPMTDSSLTEAASGSEPQADSNNTETSLNDFT